ALGALERALETEVAHHGGDEGALLEAFGADHPRRAQGHDGVSVDLDALLVDDDHAVGVTVEGDADVRTPGEDLTRARGGMKRTDTRVDVVAVGLDADGDGLGAELAEDER